MSVPTDVQILTQFGWAGPEALMPGTMVASYDVQTDTASWAPITGVRWSEAPVTHLATRRGIDATVTDDHPWPAYFTVLGKTKRYDYRRLRATRDVMSGDRLIGACPLPAGTAGLTTADATALGLAAGIATMTPGGLLFASRDYRLISEVVGQALDTARIHAGYRNAGDNKEVELPTGTVFVRPRIEALVPAEATTALFARAGINRLSELPRIAPGLSLEARRALLVGLKRVTATANGSVCHKTRPWLLELFAALAALEGYVVTPVPGRHDTLRVKYSRFTYGDGLQRSPGPAQPVWSPQTALGTWVARFPSGAVTITGGDMTEGGSDA